MNIFFPRQRYILNPRISRALLVYSLLVTLLVVSFQLLFTFWGFIIVALFLRAGISSFIVGVSAVSLDLFVISEVRFVALG